MTGPDETKRLNLADALVSGHLPESSGEMLLSDQFAKGLGVKIERMLRAQAAVAEIRAFLEQIYNMSGRKEDLARFSDEEILELARNLTGGVPLATPVFDGATEEEIRAMLRLAERDNSEQGIPSGQTILHDGRTGDPTWAWSDDTLMDLNRYQALKMQVKEIGFSFVELLSTCPTNWGLSPTESIKRLQDELIPYFPLGVLKEKETADYI